MLNSDFSWVDESISRLTSELPSIWPDGRRVDCIPGSGPHWHLPMSNRPVSIDRLEGAFLHQLVKLVRPKLAVEIGTGFGLSSAWIASGLPKHGHLFSIDAGIEGGIGDEGLRVAQSLALRLRLSNKITFVRKYSSEFLLDFEAREEVEFAFIDGNHHDHSPLRDFEGLEPFLSDSAVVVWHDYDQRYSTVYDVNTVREKGFRVQNYQSSCGIAITAKNPELIELGNEAFEFAMSKSYR